MFLNLIQDRKVAYKTMRTIWILWFGAFMQTRIALWISRYLKDGEKARNRKATFSGGLVVPPRGHTELIASINFSNLIQFDMEAAYELGDHKNEEWSAKEMRLDWETKRGVFCDSALLETATFAESYLVTRRSINACKSVAAWSTVLCPNATF
jgi:hypothetical protein